MSLRTIHLAATACGSIVVGLGNTADEAATIAADDLRDVEGEPEPLLAVSMTGTPRSLRLVLRGMELSHSDTQLARVGLGRDVDTEDRDGLDLADLDVDDGESATA